MSKNSMLYWWPKIKHLPIPMPVTEIVELGMTNEEVFGILDFEDISVNAWNRRVPRILDAINRIKPPVFLRTDHTSGKHDWKHTCYYDGSHNIRQHISALVEYSAMADIMGLSINAIIVRQYVPMMSVFTAFSGEMPVNAERRYFIRDGKVQCHHPYWIEAAIEEGTRKEALPSDWKARLGSMNTETPEEVHLLTKYAELVAEEFDGYWSVDFCKAEDGKWVLIDMAEGQLSWHPECPERS